VPLRVNFRELIQLGLRMSPNGSGFSLDRDARAFEPIDIELEQGKEIEIDDLDTGSALLSFHGRQVLLYIRDHSRQFDEAVHDPAINGRRFHLAHCRTLERMKNVNRYERYVATARLDGFFTIADGGRWSGAPRTADVQLSVCRNCLDRLNYRNARSSPARRSEVAASFSIAHFFTHYSTCFKFMPVALERAASVGYAIDWPEISRQALAEVGYCCGDCGIDLEAHPHLCDVHHRSGIKSDNSEGNLQVLCRDCHRKQPMHAGIFISHDDFRTIQRLRSEQGRLNAAGWKEAYELSDMSIHGDLAVLQNDGFEPPLIGYDLMDRSGVVVETVEAAWPDKRVALNLTKFDLPGWTIYQVGEVCGGLG
jgi:hypothetical protein